MPSIKTCLASLAMLAMAFSPIADARKTQSGVLAARAHSALVERGNADIAAIRSARGASVTAKVASTKSKAKPAVGTIRGNRKVKAFNPYSKNSRFMKSKAVKYVTSFRCRSDAQCNQLLSVAFPKDPSTGATVARGVCSPNTGNCAVTCIEGYVPQGANCVRETPNCSAETCAQFANGYNTCSSSTGRCQYSCYDGFKLAQSTSGGNTQVQCLALDSDVNNCGAAGNVCAESYNGVGKPKCQSGVCTLRCPPGLAKKPASSATKPNTCYGPGVPLTMV